MQVFAVSEVSGSSYYNRNANSGTETDATNYFLYSNLRQLQTVKKPVSCLFAANDKHLWITYRTIVANAN